MPPNEHDRRASDERLAALETKFDGFVALVGEKLSTVQASLNLIQVAMEKLETKSDASCGKCRAELDSELHDIWAEVKKNRDRVDVLERADGERAKKGVMWAVRIIGGVILVALVGLVWSAIKGGN